MASHEIETCAERQENERQVLEAIFAPDELLDLRQKDAWKVARPPEYLLKLQPQESMNNRDIFCSVEMEVKCTSMYPDVVPKIKLQNAKGLSDSQVGVMKEELDQLSRKLKGEVMILELAQYAQTFLREHNKPPTKSFYEEMMVNKRLQEEKVAKEKIKQQEIIKKKEEKKLQAIEVEIQRHQEALREQTRKRREETKLQAGMDRLSLSEPVTPPVDVLQVTPIVPDTEQLKVRLQQSPEHITPQRQQLIAESGSYGRVERRRRTSTPRSEDNGDDPETCHDHRGTQTISFDNKKPYIIHRGRCLGHSKNGSTVYVGLNSATGELIAVSEWVLQWHYTGRKLDLDEKIQDENEATKYLKQVASIEQELLSLVRLRHPNLVHYTALKHIQQVGRILVYVLMEHIGGGSLEQQLRKGVSLPEPTLCHHTQQLLHALVYLHSKSVVHKDLRASSILLDVKGNIRLTDYSLDKRLRDLYELVDVNRPGVHFREDRPPSLGRGGKKGDVFRLGMVLLSLATGVSIQDHQPVVPASLPAQLHDFLNKCLESDERLRWSAQQLLDHSFVKTPIYSYLPVPRTDSQQTHQTANNRLEEEDEDDSVVIPYIPTSNFGQSRLKSEFEILKWLGKGGFGDVIKVRNKLDGRFYAIKRIPLNTKSQSFKKKITREVKLLSRLNHENVVRYYNSWIEVSEEAAPDSSTSTFDTTPSTVSSAAKSSTDKRDLATTKACTMLRPQTTNSFGLRDDFENNVPAAIEDSIEWSVSVSHSNNNNSDSSDDEEEDDDDDENNVFGASFLPMSDDEDSENEIVFEQESKYFGWEDKEESVVPAEKTFNKGSLKAESTGEESTLETAPRLQFLYIQMEFCDKSTLRTVIDSRLYLDVDRVWRLFREIIEGLQHIHDQGMIHRDLKPTNIFMDSQDHVKIGDFGLATTDILCQQHTSLMELNPVSQTTLNCDSSVTLSESLGDGNLTGKVGSALYVSPEMLTASTRTRYSQKVDIYSLGIIFFEMCYRPLTTGMERVKVISMVRQPTIELPEDLDEVELPQQVEIVRWLLNHDASKRPTTYELLQSDKLPPPLLEESELADFLRSTIADPESRPYKHLINTIFSQPVLPARDFTYDLDLHKGVFSPVASLVHMDVMARLERIFQKHGGVRLALPLLMPRSSMYEKLEQYVCLADHSGAIISLPYDLRVPFARYVARNNINHIKRYNIEKVYREKHQLGVHPRELTECAFDIINTPGDFLLPFIEIFQIVTEVLIELPTLQNRGYYVRMNHTLLLQAILFHCGVPEELHQNVLEILGDTKQEKQRKLQLQTRLCSLSLSANVVFDLYSLMEVEGPYDKVASMLRCITKSRGQAAGLAKRALREIETITKYIEILGCKLQVVLALGLVYNAHHYTGPIFQVVANIQRKRRTALDVLAAGGRFDSLVSKFERPSALTTQHTNRVAVGISFSLEKLIAAVTDSEDFQVPGCYDILVASLGHNPLLKEKLNIAKQLWAAGQRTHILSDCSLSLEEIQHLCKEMLVAHLVLLKDSESDTARVRSLEKDKIVDRKFTNLTSNMSSLVDYLKQSNRLDNSECSQCGSNKGAATPTISMGDSVSLSGANIPPTNITFLQVDNSKLAFNTKKRYEHQIYASLSSALSVISSKAHVEVLASDLTGQIIKTIAAYIELDSDDFEGSTNSIIEKHQRYKKYFGKLFDIIQDWRIEKKSCVIVLYSLKDDTFRMLL